MSDYPMGGRSAAYFDAMRELDKALDDALSHVRAEHDAGRITSAAAAAGRIGLLERHIAEGRRLRRQLLGEAGDEPGRPA